MPVYRVGSHGDEVRQIQSALGALGLYRGPLDGVFGGATEAAVKSFQKSSNLSVDGIVGPITWKALFKRKIPPSGLAAKPLDYKCLALTGAFETNAGIPDCFAGLSGDFDGQGISFGVLQWNFGQDSLQPLLRDMIASHPGVVREIFHEHYPVLTAALEADKAELMSFAQSVQHPVRHTISEPWGGMFRALGRTDEFQAIQRAAADKLFKAAQKLAGDYGLRSERAVALMFDIKTQNGSISTLVKAQILADFAALPADLPEEKAEVEKMRIVANRRADAANPRWAEDVRARKLCIANGGGVVHGVHYDLEGQFGIRLHTSFSS